MIFVHFAGLGAPSRLSQWLGIHCYKLSKWANALAIGMAWVTLAGCSSDQSADASSTAPVYLIVWATCHRLLHARTRAGVCRPARNLHYAALEDRQRQAHSAAGLLKRSTASSAFPRRRLGRPFLAGNGRSESSIRIAAWRVFAKHPKAAVHLL